MAIADNYLSSTGQAVWSDLTVGKAVKEGYKKNSWVYRAIRLIAIAGSSVPWIVQKDGEYIDEHPLSMLMKNPNPNISRQTLFELLITWLQLSGNAYLIPVVVRGNTSELWPCSPDRLHPVPDPGNDSWIKGYSKGSTAIISYEPEEVIHFLFPDPSNPIIGIGPLQAASKAVDTDTEQQDWNKSIMQNKGVLDGVFSFKREFKNQADIDDLTDRLNEKFSGKAGRRIGAVGSEATYTRIAATPSEVDYVNGRKFNREEIFIIFGVPPVLAGVMDVATYNNYATSELVFWMSTIIPLLDDLKDTLNFSFRNELKEGEVLTYDISRVPAVRKARLDLIESGERLSKMGVPVEVINKMLDLGVTEYDGWDKTLQAVQKAPVETRSPFEKRSSEKKIERRDDVTDEKEKDTVERAGEFEAVLLATEERVLAALDTGGDIKYSVVNDQAMYDLLEKTYTQVGNKWAAKEVREAGVPGAIELYLQNEAVILREKSLIDDSTVKTILEQVEDAHDQGLPIQTVAQALKDTGIFSAERALRIARTVVGTAASVGQFVAGQETGAQYKTWRSAGFNVRAGHEARNGETVGINERFSIRMGSSVGPRFPGDPDISAADRVNCRCSLTFS
jgi:HK97 family phage portal protein